MAVTIKHDPFFYNTIHIPDTKQCIPRHFMLSKIRHPARIKARSHIQCSTDSALCCMCEPALDVKASHHLITTDSTYFIHAIQIQNISKNRPLSFLKQKKKKKKVYKHTSFGEKPTLTIVTHSPRAQLDTKALKVDSDHSHT